MFWDSVVSGIKVLLYWETYVVGLMYLAIFFIPIVIAGLVMERSEAAAGILGCLSMLLLPLLQVAAMLVFILSLSPIIFGFAEDAAWSFPWKIITLAPASFFKLVGFLTAISIGLAFVPLLGRLQSLNTLILGALALAFVLGIFDSINPGIVKGRVDFYPDFWFSAGLLIIGGIMSWVGMMAAALIVTGIEMVTEEGIGQLIMFPLGAVFGFIPVFIYGAWLGAQVKGGF